MAKFSARFPLGVGYRTWHIEPLVFYDTYRLAPDDSSRSVGVQAFGRLPGTHGRLEAVHQPAQSDSLQLASQVEAIKIHHLVPGRDKVFDKLFLRIRTGIHFGNRSQL